MCTKYIWALIVPALAIAASLISGAFAQEAGDATSCPGGGSITIRIHGSNIACAIAS